MWGVNLALLPLDFRLVGVDLALLIGLLYLLAEELIADQSPGAEP